MSPPTEQLVRDYLNRLSVAARSRLSLRERQVLLDRTRTRIEAETGGVADASPMLVRQVLANLGDPIGLVDAEYAADPQLAAVAPAPAPAQANGSAVFLAKLGGLPDSNGHGSNGHGRNGLANGAPLHAGIAGLPAGSVLASAGPAGASAPSGDAGPGEPATAPDGAGQGTGAGPAQDGGPAGDGGDSAASPGPNQSQATQIPPVPAPRPASEDEPARDEAAPAVAAPLAETPADEPADDELPKEPSRAAEVADAAISFGRGLATVAWRHKLEMLAVLLIGLGGALYPPVWLLGVALVIPSKVWDLRDKWLSLGLPVLVVLFGAVLAIVTGGQRHQLTSYGYEAWLAAGRLSRVVAVAGAVYLLERLRRGRRTPKLPPWKTAKKFDV